MQYFKSNAPTVGVLKPSPVGAAGQLDARLVGCPAGRLAGGLAGRLAGWRVGEQADVKMPTVGTFFNKNICFITVLSTFLMPYGT